MGFNGGEQADVAEELLVRLKEWGKTTPRLKTYDTYKPWQAVLWKSAGQRKARYGLKNK